MDSASQIVLGASLAYLTLGKQLGKRALLVGAALGTVPDMDVLVQYSDAVESFTYHRSWSHSLLVLSLLSLPAALLLSRLFKGYSVTFSRWWLATFLVLITHPLLDSFTIYGTQIAWPLPIAPTALGSIFIIDPVYTLPLAFACIVAWRKPYARAHLTASVCLGISCAYLIWTLIAQNIIRNKLDRTIASQGINADSTLIAPFPFSLLWRTVAVSGNQYFEGYSSLLDDASTIHLDTYDNGKGVCQEWLTHWPIKRLDWFTKGNYALSIRDDTLVVSDLRMGIEDSYVFEFAVAQWQNQQWQKIQTRQMPLSIDTTRMSLLFSRMVNENVNLAPVVTEQLALNEQCQA